MFRKQFFLLYIIVCVLSLSSCTDNTHEEALCQAEALMDAERYEEALALLDTLDGRAFSDGSRQQARYALLYTKARYKNYIVSPSDSLISLAVDYAEGHGNKMDKFYAYLFQGIVRYELNDYSESSVCLLRALANSEYVDDHYAKGQMHTYLALVNGVQHCSDEDYYAQEAFREFTGGRLTPYIESAMVTKAVAKIHVEEYDSAFYWLEKSEEEAKTNSNTYVLENAQAAKAGLAVIVDSIQLAERLYTNLVNETDYLLLPLDLVNIGVIKAMQGDSSSAYAYLNKARRLSRTPDERGVYWSNAAYINRLLANKDESLLCQDSLIHYLYDLLDLSLQHASIASQRDYVQWKLQLVEQKNHNSILLFLFLLLCLFFVTAIFILYYRKRQVQIKLQVEKIEKLQLQIKQLGDTNASNLQTIKLSPEVRKIQEAVTFPGSVRVDWHCLYELFCFKLPHFEQSLRELSSLSDTEWRVCMLLKLGFSPSNIAVLMNKSAEAISSIRRRLFYKVFQKKGRASDWDKFIETL